MRILTRIDSHLGAVCEVVRRCNELDNDDSKCYVIVKVIKGSLYPYYEVGSEVFLSESDYNIV